MADKTDPSIAPRPYVAEPRVPHETHVHTTPPPPPAKSGSGAVLAFIVGGLVVGVAALYMLFSPGSAPAPDASAPAGNSTTINVEPGAAPAPAEPAPADTAPEPPAAGETEAAPAPAD